MSEGSRTRSDDALPKASLGKRRETPVTYTPELLEGVPFTADAEMGTNASWVSLNCLRFTSLCPVTGQPDWAEITINYLPGAQLIESKSLKEYLHSFRMHRDFHEDVCRIICRDLAGVIAPRYLEVLGHFDSRGSIAIWPYAQYAADGDAEAQEICAYRLREYAPGKWFGGGDRR